jgi:solute carrier family 50 protein (sugar transporter)
MISSSFVWLMYGILKGVPSVWGPNTVGLALGAYYFAVFVRNCGPEATDLPGTAKQHLHGTIGIVSINLCLAVMGASGVGYATDIIGKEGVVMCIVLFSSPLTVLRSVIATKSAASIPLPFTLATFVNCIAWFVLGWWKAKDFNIYFPNVLGLSCAVAQLVLKGVYGNGTGGAKEELLPSTCSEAGDRI